MKNFKMRPNQKYEFAFFSISDYYILYNWKLDSYYSQLLHYYIEKQSPRISMFLPQQKFLIHICETGWSHICCWWTIKKSWLASGISIFHTLVQIFVNTDWDQAYHAGLYVLVTTWVTKPNLNLYLHSVWNILISAKLRQH